MDEIMMWSLESDGASYAAKKVDHVSQMDAESQLEELLVKTPEVLMPNLQLVGRQTPTQSGFLDLLGIDEDGNLVVFELKKGSLSRDAVAQSIDYASYLDQLSRESLAQHITERSGTGGIQVIENFDDWYHEQFPNSPYGYAKHPRIVLVGLGADETTERMAGYLSSSNLDISLITFHGFVIDGKTVLAKHIKVKAPDVDNPDPGKYTKTENLKVLKALAEKTGTTQLFNTASLFLREKLPGYQWPSRSGYSFSLMEQTDQGTPTYRAYASLYMNEKKRNQVQLVIWQRAVGIVPELIAEFQQQTDCTVNSSGNLEVWLNPIKWETLKDNLGKILTEVMKGWRRKQEVDID